MPHLIFLHGFLGLPSDWAPWTAQLPEGTTWEAPALHPESESDSVSVWARRFASGRSQSWLVGYSQGARLGLELMAQFPKQFCKALLVGPNLGMVDRAERNLRLVQDQRWAQAFLTHPWSDVVTSWERHAVFAGHHWDRPESAFSRPLLARSLEVWSVAHQEPRGVELRDWPVTWVCGSKEPLTRARFINRGLQPVVLEGGHRCPWQSPQVFSHLLNEFIKEDSRG